MGGNRCQVVQYPSAGPGRAKQDRRWPSGSLNLGKVGVQRCERAGRFHSETAMFPPVTDRLLSVSKVLFFKPREGGGIRTTGNASATDLGRKGHQPSRRRSDEVFAVS